MKNVKLTFEELVNAYGAYRRVSRSPKNKNTVVHFCNFLDVDDEVWNRVYSHSEITEDAAHKIKWLTGPNARALYKAWCVKHGDNKR